MADWIDQMVLQCAEQCREIATRQGNVPFLTGDLRKSIISYTVRHGVAACGSNLPYARAVHDGRPAITIRRKNRKALRFQVNAKTVFAREVHQPARPGKPFLTDAVREMDDGNYEFLIPMLSDAVGDLLARSVVNQIHININR